MFYALKLSMFIIFSGTNVDVEQYLSRLKFFSPLINLAPTHMHVYAQILHDSS